jgi:peroxiredoxin
MVTRRQALLTLPAAFAAARLQAADVPRPTPNMVFRKPEGGVIDLKEFRGKVIALEFLNTTCPHCQRCSKILQQMQNEYNAKGFQALGVATNEMAQILVADYKKNLGVYFPIGYASSDESHSFLQHSPMLIMYVPQLVFIDRKGVIRAQFAGNDPFFKDEERNVRAQIEALLKEGVAPAGSRKPARRKSGAA